MDFSFWILYLFFCIIKLISRLDHYLPCPHWHPHLRAFTHISVRSLLASSRACALKNLSFKIEDRSITSGCFFFFFSFLVKPSAFFPDFVPDGLRTTQRIDLPLCVSKYYQGTLAGLLVAIIYDCGTCLFRIRDISGRSPPRGCLGIEGGVCWGISGSICLPQLFFMVWWNNGRTLKPLRSP